MIGDLIGEWIKGILIDGIMGNLSGLFNTVNTKVGEIASDVGSTPQDWNGGIFSMLQNLSETVIVPIAAAILWGDRIFEKCGIRRDEGGDGGKTLEIRGKRRLSARDGGANYQQS